MTRTCCENYSKQPLPMSMGTKGVPVNTRYKHMSMPPMVQGLSLNINSMGGQDVAWYSEDVNLTIRKRGCTTDCAEELNYCSSVREANKVYFIFDEKYYGLCRGRYEGIVTIGCYELPCRLDFRIGQQLCFDDVHILSSDKEEFIMSAADLPDPNCCETCEQPKPCGCFDATQQQHLGGNSISSPPEELLSNECLVMAQCELDKLNAWMNGQCKTGQ